MIFNKKKSFLYSSILLLILIGVSMVSATVGFTDFYITGNGSSTYSSGSITLNWKEVNVTDPLYTLNYTTNITYWIYGSQANASGTHNAFVLLGTMVNASRIGTSLSTLTFANVTGISANYTFRINATLYNITGFQPLSSNLSQNVSIYTDAADPSATIVEPSDTSISVFRSILYTCNSADALSGVASCTFKSKKPGGTEKTLSCSSEQTLTGDDTNEPGGYTLTCTVTDVSGRSNTDTATFTASHASSGGSTSSSSSSSSGSSADNPLTISPGVTKDIGTLSTTADTYVSVPASSGLKFMVSGESHSAKILTVSTSSTTIEFASTPSQLILNIGETKEVDLNDNDMNDLSVMLRSITNGVADLTFKIITEAASAQPTPTPTEQPPTTQPSGEVLPEEAKSNLTWLWILIIVVVIALVWYFSKKKK